MSSMCKLFVYFYNNINLILKVKNINAVTENNNITNSNNEEITEAIIQNNNTTKIGNIYYCQILKYQINLNAYFVDLGNNTYGLLKYNKQAEKILKNPTIGQKFLVIVTKEGTENKYPLVSPYIILKGLYCNFIPYDLNITFDKKIILLTEKNNICDEIRYNYPKIGFGLYIKDIGNVHNLIHEINIKYNLWQKISLKIKNNKIGLVYKSSPLLNMIFNDSNNIPNTIVGNSLSTLEIIKNELNDSIPFINISLQHDNSNIDYIKYLEKLEDQLSNEIFVNQDITLNIYNTKALTFIDIDFKGNNTLTKEDSFLQANLEAILPITKLIKFRNISGQIFIDILKVKNPKYKDIILQKYKETFNKYNLKAIILGFTKLNILEIEKPKNSSPLESNYYDSCPNCHGTGKVINYSLLHLKAILEIQNILKTNPLANITIKSTKKNIEQFKTYNADYIKLLNSNNLNFIIDNTLINCIIIY